MFSATQVWLAASAVGGGGGGAGVPTRSLSFTSASTQYLSMAHANFANYDRAKYAFSIWWQRSITGGNKILYAKGDSSAGSTEFYLQFNSNQLQFVTHSSVDGTLNGQLKTTATYTDTVSFHHMMVHFDSANATAGDRMRMWVDGAEIASFATDTNPTASTATVSGQPAQIGAIVGVNRYDGLIFQPTLFSGYLPSISEVYNAGAPKDVSLITGAVSLLNTNATDALEDDYFLATNWTNNGTVIKSTTIP